MEVVVDIGDVEQFCVENVFTLWSLTDPPKSCSISGDAKISEGALIMSVKYFYDLISTNEQIVDGGLCVVKTSLLHLNPLPAVSADSTRRGRGRPPPTPPTHLPPPAPLKRAVLVLDAEHCLDRLYGGCFPGRCRMSI